MHVALLLELPCSMLWCCFGATLKMLFLSMLLTMITFKILTSWLLFLST
jgi:hypothetical protein